MRKKWMMLVIVVMFFVLLPVGIAQAATYEMKADPQQNKMLYVDEEMAVKARVYKNGKKLSCREKSIPVEWESSNEKIVFILGTNSRGYEDASAVVRGLKAGSATITAKYKGKSVSYKVTVKKAGIRPEVSYSKVAYVPEGCELNARVEGWSYWVNHGMKIKFSIKDPSIAALSDEQDHYATIKGVKQGSTVLTAKSKQGTVKIKVVVLPKLQLRVNNFKSVIKQGKLVGYSFNLKNNGSKTITVLQGFIDDGFGRMCYYADVDGGSVVVKKGQTKKVVVLIDDIRENTDFQFTDDGRLSGEYFIGVAMKYEGQICSVFYGSDAYGTDGKTPFRYSMGQWD